MAVGGGKMTSKKTWETDDYDVKNQGEKIAGGGTSGAC